MDRRAFLAVAAAGGLIAMPVLARSQQAGKAHRIGFLFLQSGLNSTTEAFRQELRELAYVEGRNLIIEYRWADTREDRLPELAAQHRLPAMYDVRAFVEAGGLVSYGPSLPESLLGRADQVIQ